MPPDDKRYCGAIYAIMYVDNVEPSEKESLKWNNFGVDAITLKCHEAGMPYVLSNHDRLLFFYFIKSLSISAFMNPG